MIGYSVPEEGHTIRVCLSHFTASHLQFKGGIRAHKMSPSPVCRGRGSILSVAERPSYVSGKTMFLTFSGTAICTDKFKQDQVLENRHGIIVYITRGCNMKSSTQIHRFLFPNGHTWGKLSTFWMLALTVAGWEGPPAVHSILQRYLITPLIRIRMMSKSH